VVAVDADAATDLGTGAGAVADGGGACLTGGGGGGWGLWRNPSPTLTSL
jgi:hypothetical protein